MSVVEETRQVIQDLPAPELRAISARLDSLEKQVTTNEVRVEKRFDSIDRRFDAIDRKFESIDSKFESVEAKAERRHQKMLLSIAQLSNYQAVLERVARLESTVGEKAH